VPEFQLKLEASVGANGGPRFSDQLESCRVVDLVHLHGDGDGQGTASRYPMTTVNEGLLHGERNIKGSRAT